MENNILMPRLGVNEDSVTLAQWLVKTGDKVKKGQRIAVIETTKETNEVTADVDGVITLCVGEGEEVSVNSVIAVIGEASIDIIEERELSDQYKITEKARALIDKYQIDISMLPKNHLIKEKDILKLIKEPYTIAQTKGNEILIYGGSGFGKIAINIIRQKRQFNVHGVLDILYPDKRECLGVPVIGGPDLLEKLYKEGYHNIVNAVGFVKRAHARKAPYEMMKKIGFDFPNIIHERAILEEETVLGEGNIICAGAVIGPDAKIGSNCLINTGSVVAHDCIISDHCHIASGAVLAGGVIVGENTLIGQNCTVYNEVKIGSNVVIQNGCHVFKDVRDNEVVRLGR